MSQFLHGYTITSTILQGPIWDLYQVENTQGQAQWLAHPDPHLGHDEKTNVLLQDSFREGYGLRHPHIIELLQMDLDEYGPFLLFAPSDAIPIAQFALLHPPDAATAGEWMIQLCRALQHGHLNGVFHGCLGWPAVFVTSGNEIKVAYFGTGRIFAHACQHWPDRILPYAAMTSPQRLENPDLITSSGELYSVGVIYYQLLTGQPFFQAQTMDDLVVEKKQPWQDHDSLSRIENEIISRLLSSDPAEQYLNCRELINHLNPSEAFVVAEPISNKSEGRLPLWTRYIRNRAKTLFPSTMVGMKRRVTLTFFLIAMLVFIGILVTLISELGHEDWQNQALYQAFIAEQDSIKLTALEKSQLSEPERSSSTDRIAAVAKPTPSTIQRSIPMTNSPSSTNGSAIQFVSLSISGMVDSAMTDVDVYISNRLEGQSTVSGPLIVHGLAADNSYEVRLQKQGYATWQQRYTPRAHSENVIAAHLQPLTDAMRRFTLSRVTFADRVSIDGRLPSLVLPCEVDLFIGSHELRYIDTASGFQWSTNITLDINTSRAILFSGEQAGMGQLSIVLANPGRYGYAFVFMPGQSRTQTTPLRQSLAVGRYPLRIFRDGFLTLPSDTTVFIKPNQEINILVQMSPM